MEVNCKETVIECYQVIYEEEVRCGESVESVVPDTLPDIGTVLSTCGTPLIRSKDLSAGRVRVDANIPVRVAYQPEEGEGVCVLDVNIPVSVSQEQAELDENCVCTADLRLIALETKLLNPRKIAVRAEVCFALRCCRMGSERFAGAPETAEWGIHVLTKEAALSPVRAVTEKTFVLTDEFRLPPERPEIGKLLCQKTLVETEELKTAGTKVIVKGCAKSCLVYLSPEGTPAAVEFSTGFSQIVEAGTLPEDAGARATLLLSGAYYDPDAADDGRTVGMELHLVAQVTVCGREKALCLADAYSNLYALTLQREERTACALSREVTLRETLRVTAETPTPVAEILSAWAEPGCATVSGGEVTLPLSVQIWYLCPAGLLHCLRRSFPLKLQTELAAGERLALKCVSLQEVYAAPGSGGIELRIPAEVSADVIMERTLPLVTGIDCDETQPLDLSAEPTLTLLRVSDGDDLWALARENHSALETIREVNGLDAETGPWSRLLLIPKTLF